MTLNLLIASFAFIVAFSAQAQTFVGTFVMSKGDVKVLSLATEDSAGPMLIYEEKKYLFKPVKLGTKVSPDDIVQTGTNGRAKIAFANGDHFNIGPASSLSMPKPGADKSQPATINLFYGKMRSLISKKGPRNNLKVTTPAATAGVRGTDFYVRHTPKGSKLSVLRGEVLVKELKAGSKPVSVKKGFSAKMRRDTDLKLEAADKQELVEIQSETAANLDKKSMAALSKEMKSEINILQAQTAAAALSDIKDDDPELYKELQAKKITSSDEISTLTVANLVKMAPGKITKKPTKEDLDAIGEGLYDKYFHPAQ